MNRNGESEQEQVSWDDIFANSHEIIPRRTSIASQTSTAVNSEDDVSEKVRHILLSECIIPRIQNAYCSPIQMKQSTLSVYEADESETESLETLRYSRMSSSALYSPYYMPTRDSSLELDNYNDYGDRLHPYAVIDTGVENGQRRL